MFKSNYFLIRLGPSLKEAKKIYQNISKVILEDLKNSPLNIPNGIFVGEFIANNF